MILRLLTLLLFLCITTGVCPSEVKAAQKIDLSQVKAAYLYNFAKFIKWPDSSFKEQDSPFIIGVIGDQKLYDQLKPLEQKVVRNRAIKIKRYTTLEQTNCHLVYIDKPSEEQIKSILKKPVISVSDKDTFVDYGGSIQLIEVRGRLRFIINQKQAHSVNIKVDSQLLSLALEVLEAV